MRTPEQATASLQADLETYSRLRLSVLRRRITATEANLALLQGEAATLERALEVQTDA